MGIYRLEARTVTLPRRRPRTTRPTRFPSPQEAVRIIEGTRRRNDTPYLFPAESVPRSFTSWHSAKQAVDSLCLFYDWRFHDLRRSAVSHMAAPPLSVQPHILQALINHQSQAVLSPVARVYLRYSYQQECAEAVERWQEYLLGRIARVD